MRRTDGVKIFEWYNTQIQGEGGNREVRENCEAAPKGTNIKMSDNMPSQTIKDAVHKKNNKK